MADIKKETIACFSDFHIHTNFSFDSKEKIENVCVAAFNSGLSSIAITNQYDHDGIEEGLYSEYTEEGRLKLRCIYKDDKKDGHYVEYDEEGRLKLVCSYKDGKKEGFYKRMEQEGRLFMFGEYQNDMKTGLFEVYARGALVIKGNHLNDKKDGQFQEFYPGTQQLKCESSYKEDKLDGLYKEYNQDGTLKKECVYEMGIIKE
ncbi:MAG: hypothetical protein J6V36_04025 [Clostridia bacterium]|nr:hypothetical protein [Clostridia bacterium]